MEIVHKKIPCVAVMTMDTEELKKTAIMPNLIIELECTLCKGGKLFQDRAQDVLQDPSDHLHKASHIQIVCGSR